jgi:hypothetical protein
MSSGAISARTSWKLPTDLFLSRPIVLRSSKRSYVLWGISLLLAIWYTWWFYALLSMSLGERSFQIAFALMAGLDIFIVLKLVDALIRKITLDNNGFKFQALFQPEKVVWWEEVERITVWQSGRKMIYWIYAQGDKVLLSFDSSGWSQPKGEMGYKVLLAQVSPIPAKPDSSWFKSALFIPLVILGVSFFSFSDEHWLRVVGSGLARLFWGAFLLGQRPQNLPQIRLYLAIVSLAVLVSLAVITGADFIQVLFWWLYSPMLDVVLSFVIIPFVRLLKAKRKVKA